MTMKYQGISVFTQQPIEVDIQGTTISSITELQGNQELPYISPGLFDMQVNGYHGSDYSLEDFSEVHLRHIIASLAAAGTTQHIPTIVTRPAERILRTLRLISNARKNSSDIAAAIPGIHLEGPYISSEDGPRGAHDSAYIRDPDFAEFEVWQEAADGQIRLITIAPERTGAIEFIRQVTAAGVVVAIGHTAASPEIIHEAIVAGARISTHLGNGSHAMIPRLKNYIWEQLACDELMAGIICDGLIDVLGN